MERGRDLNRAATTRNWSLRARRGPDSRSVPVAIEHREVTRVEGPVGIGVFEPGGVRMCDRLIVPLPYVPVRTGYPGSLMTDDAPAPRGGGDLDGAGRPDSPDAQRSPDPRLDSEYVRRVPADPPTGVEAHERDGGGSDGAGGDHRRAAAGDGVGTVVLVGVVHDHPSSTYRVRELLARERPAVLALELPSLAVGLFERYAVDEQTPPAFGGEMSAAIQVASVDRVAGIDGPGPKFLRRLVGTLRREDASLSTIRATARRVASITRHAIGCRLAASLDAHTSVRARVGSPTAHECQWDDPPDRQAADERRQVRRAASVASALQSGPASRCCEAARESHMAARLDDLRKDGDVLAVVGIGHLDAVADRLRDE